MNANNIQSCIAINATRIADTEIFIAANLDLAKYQKSTGEIAFSIASYNKVSQLQRKLGKAVALQHSLKSELAHVFRVAKIEAKMCYLAATTGIVLAIDNNATSFEALMQVENAIFMTSPTSYEADF